METKQSEYTVEKKVHVAESCVEKEEVYWLDISSDKLLDSNNKIKLFHHDDIVTSKLNPIHLNRLIRRKLGKTTSKQDDEGELSTISQLHEKAKNTFKNVFMKSFEEVMVSVALEIGMRDGRSKFIYKDIAKHVLQNPNYFTICRTAYIMRGMFERHFRWKIKLEEKIMNKLGFKYKNGFVSREKNFGCFCNLISEIVTNKHRDMNTRFKKKHGFRIVQRSKEHANKVEGRLRPDNKNFFGLMKNVQVDRNYSNSIDYSIPKKLKFQKNENNEVHFDILENIVFPPRSISKVFFILGQWVDDFKVHVDEKEESSASSDEENIPLAEEKSDDEITPERQKKRSEKKKGLKPGKRNRVVLAQKSIKSKKKRKIIESSDSEYECENYKKQKKLEEEYDRFLKDYEKDETEKLKITEEEEENESREKKAKVDESKTNQENIRKKEMELTKEMEKKINEITEEVKEKEIIEDEAKRTTACAIIRKTKVNVSWDLNFANYIVILIYYY